ncbi:MAG: 5-(carboxyamino)imidazole ribonucleotide mutase [Candidatus Nomurabacteria bacterium]|jgi:5-(carboxyamino)imidazole ribonucleotide mutase|nr:5-(carboxyamino)imidazole ribonucleotide mutase [Candidatus Nomurabacteria bacterium]
MCRYPGNGTDPLVGVIMGSDSDLPIVGHASEVLENFGVPHEVGIVSAHRTPDIMELYAETAAKRGIMAIIAGAGGSAHLPGMTAAYTTLPVIGVAVETSSDATNSALGSMIKMPEGTPLAVTGKNAAAAGNAALLAIRILAITNPELAKKLQEYAQRQAAKVLSANGRLNVLGVHKYIANPDDME